MTKRSANIAFSVLVIGACVVFAIIAAGFDNPSALSGAQVPTQAFPIAILAFTAFCSAINILQYVTANPEGDAEAPLDMNAALALRVGLIVGLLVVTYYIWDVVGFVPTSIILCLGIAAVMQVRSPLTYVGLALFGPMIWALFRYGLGIDL